MPLPLCVIRIKNCAFFARHGVLNEERLIGQRFYVDIEFAMTACSPLEADDLGETVDYGQVFLAVQSIVENERFCLIEALAHRIGTALRERYVNIGELAVTVRKPGAPVPGVLDFVEVCLRWPV